MSEGIVRLTFPAKPESISTAASREMKDSEPGVARRAWTWGVPLSAW